WSSRFAAARWRADPEATIRQGEQRTRHHDKRAIPDERHIRLPPYAHHDRTIARFIAKRNIDLAEPQCLDARFSRGHLARREETLGRFDLSKAARAGIEQRERAAIFGE